jgi:nucleotidyltransferase AbiEii toxin of type IV toxin-antitoxin system
VEKRVIPEPQKTYVLELLYALGTTADEFVVAGAQAMKFMMERARATKDIDFVLDVVRLRSEPQLLGAQLEKLGYAVVDGSRNFQFEKPIPNSRETMRIEFMAPEEFKRAERDFRVDIQKGVHARACTGGTIAVAESEIHQLTGRLPDGSDFTAQLRVTKPHALVMLKLLALDDRYRNVRGPAESRHDREEARTHAADIVAIVSAQTNLSHFKEGFERQFEADRALGRHVLQVLDEYFGRNISPGMLVYEEFLVADSPIERDARQQVAQEIERSHQLMKTLLPS